MICHACAAPLTRALEHVQGVTVPGWRSGSAGVRAEAGGSLERLTESVKTAGHEAIGEITNATTDAVSPPLDGIELKGIGAVPPDSPPQALALLTVPPILSSLIPSFPRRI